MSDELFDLTLTEDQALVREQTTRFAESELRAKSREADEAASAPEDFYTKTLDLGLAMTPIPEAIGGGGLRSPVSNVLIAEDLGRGDMSLAIGALTPMSFVNTIIDQGSPEQQAKYLERFLGENFVAGTIALMEPRPLFDPAQLSTQAKKSSGGYAINGVKSMVALGESSELVVAIAELEGEGPAAFVVERGATGLTHANERHMGLRSLETTRLTFKDVTVPADARLGTAEKPFDLQRLVDLSRIGTGALACGVGDAVLEYVVEYCNNRVAFGEPITHKQSVAFMIANIAIELEAMRLMVYRAAGRAERGLEFHKNAYLARVACAERGMQIGTDGVQLLGGHGFIREHMVELWYRNLRAVGVLEGTVVV